MSPEIAAIGLADRREREQQLYDMLQAQKMRQDALLNAAAQNQYGTMSSQIKQQTALEMQKLAAQQAMQNSKLAQVGKRTAGFLSREDLDHPVFQMSINTLCDVWRAKFGLRWVATEDIDGTDDVHFWELARARMVGLSLLEAVNITSATERLFRIKQDPDASY